MTVAVIFTSRRTADYDDEYAVMAARMDELARQQPGFVDIMGVRDPVTREGITVSFFVDAASARAWKHHRMAETEKEKKNPAAVALGRLGGLKGGKARAEKLSAAARKRIAANAAKARWSKKPKKGAGKS